MKEDKHIILRSMWKGIKTLIRTIKLDFLKRKEENSVVLEYKWMQIKTRLRMHSLFHTVCIASV